MRAQDQFPPAPDALLVCAECGAGLLLPAKEALSRRFCSRQCLYDFQRQAMQEGRQARPPGQQTEAGRQRSLANLKMGPAASKEQRAMTAPVWALCTICNKEFPARAVPVPRFCSERCRKRDERLRGQHTVELSCAICGEPFKTGAYKPAKTCSRSCARRFGNQQKKSSEAVNSREEIESCTDLVPDAGLAPP